MLSPVVDGSCHSFRCLWFVPHHELTIFYLFSCFLPQLILSLYFSPTKLSLSLCWYVGAELSGLCVGLRYLGIYLSQDARLEMMDYAFLNKIHSVLYLSAY